MLKLKKGDKVLMKGFTGMTLGRFEVAKASKTSVLIVKTDGTELIFDLKTGLQTNVAEGKEKYANRIVKDDPEWTSPLRAGKKTKKTSKKSKAAEPIEEDDLDEILEDDEEEVVEKKSKKSKKAAKSTKKSKKAPKKEEIIEDDDDDFDDFEDDDFEDFDEE